MSCLFNFVSHSCELLSYILAQPVSYRPALNTRHCACFYFCILLGCMFCNPKECGIECISTLVFNFAFLFLQLSPTVSFLLYLPTYVKIQTWTCPSITDSTGGLHISMPLFFLANRTLDLFSGFLPLNLVFLSIMNIGNKP